MTDRIRQPSGASGRYKLGQSIEKLPPFESASFTQVWLLKERSIPCGSLIEWLSYSLPRIPHVYHTELMAFLRSLYGVVNFSVNPPPEKKIWAEANESLLKSTRISLVGKSHSVWDLLHEIERWPDETGIVYALPDPLDRDSKYKAFYRRGEAIYFLEELVPHFGQPLIRNYLDLQSAASDLGESALSGDIGRYLSRRSPNITTTWGRLYNSSWAALVDVRDEWQQQFAMKLRPVIAAPLMRLPQIPELLAGIKIARYPRALDIEEDWQTARAEFRRFARQFLTLAERPNKGSSEIDELRYLLAMCHKNRLKKWQ